MTAPSAWQSLERKAPAEGRKSVFSRFWNIDWPEREYWLFVESGKAPLERRPAN
jgi:hypothetical protein